MITIKLSAVNQTESSNHEQIIIYLLKVIVLMVIRLNLGLKRLFIVVVFLVFLVLTQWYKNCLNQIITQCYQFASNKYPLGLSGKWKIINKRGECCMVNWKMLAYFRFHFNNGNKIIRKPFIFYGSPLKWILIEIHWNCYA